jgi:MFS family permease
MILAISLSGLILPTPWSLWALMIFLAGFGLFQGMQGVIFNFLMAKVIPVSKRGRLTGMRNFLAGIISAMVAWLSGQYLVGDTPTAAGYSYTFLLSFVLTSIGLSALVAVREPEPPTVRPKERLRTRLAQMPALLRDDRAFTRYFLARALATLGRMAMPFYILHEGHTAALVRCHARHPHVRLHAVGNVFEPGLGSARRPKAFESRFSHRSRCGWHRPYC